jgi:hypothetical protein
MHFFLYQQASGTQFYLSHSLYVGCNFVHIVLVSDAVAGIFPFIFVVVSRPFVGCGL